VAIVGAGDPGAAIARELASSELRIALLDSGDVGGGTSKANTAILHTGFDAHPGTHEARGTTRRPRTRAVSRLRARGRDSSRADGALLVAWNDDELSRFAAIRENAARRGYGRVAEVSVEDLYGREPNLGPGALGALEIPDD
jgi:glycerol-3-phosphate dehydrogenase